ncbi:GyrI-like domain-containing protein [Wukongibacter baidiensis]|uniref:GyrI-like domain-containing protein n=1 Tax=Wukongibacter baidiensis TaxID=1723361 RepID=UPI003D7FD0AA
MVRIENLQEKKLIGMSKEMSFMNDKTFELWNGFMKKHSNIKNRVDSNFISMNVYGKKHTPDTEFEKWAVVEVTDFDDVPNEMLTYVLQGGLYAVFIHKGPANAFHLTQQYIFEKWLPSSQYELDHREHFEVLKKNYRPDDPNAEEEVWIPIKPKNNESKNR